jgi:alpha-galactosidase
MKFSLCGFHLSSRNLIAPPQRVLDAAWLRLYKDKMLPRREYLGGLYDIDFDRPEAHAISNGGGIYYAEFARSWSGPVELRGLEDRSYRVVDYVNNKDLGRVHGPTARIAAGFNQHLLLEARPE